MTNVASLASIAALIGDPARAAILVSLMDGRALTAGELAEAAGVAPPTASGHLGRLLDAGLLAVERQGRHRYYRIAGAPVAATLEGLMALSTDLANATCKPIRTGPRDPALRRARRCYDHLAGEVAVGIADALEARGHLRFGPDGGVITEPGLDFLATLGVEFDAGREGAAFCRPCLDWSERRPHLAGAVGRGLYAAFAAKGWIRQPRTGRAVAITPVGQMELHRHFGIALA
ncbi:MAG TPA: helix-turn-helix transcriptional regulator [Sphingomonas sp.]|nr:helix-turn-helix transcriptional regulator [Sphingomonas sp.]